MHSYLLHKEKHLSDYTVSQECFMNVDVGI